MAKKEYRIKVDPIEVLKTTRNEAIKDMIATTGGTARIHKNRKAEEKRNPAGRKAKYRKLED